MLKLIKRVAKGYLLWFWYYVYEPYRNERKKEAQRRMAVCEACEHLWKPMNTCKVCGCVMSVKTKMWFELDENGKSVDGCWEKKW
jgi:hypothetical protein